MKKYFVLILAMLLGFSVTGFAEDVTVSGSVESTTELDCGSATFSISGDLSGVTSDQFDACEITSNANAAMSLDFDGDALSNGSDSITYTVAASFTGSTALAAADISSDPSMTINAPTVGSPYSDSAVTITIGTAADATLQEGNYSTTLTVTLSDT